MGATQIPRQMKALVAQSAVPEHVMGDAAALAAHIQLQDAAVPAPGPGEVLIQVHRATINPNDLYHVKGVYSGTEGLPFPRALGFEGAGIVVASGPGLIGRFRIGSRVAFYAMGMFAQYVVCKALDLIDIPSSVDFDVAACSVANPMTALSMLEVAKASGSRHVINTAAASALGRLLIRGARQYGVELICIVRKPEQEAICRAEGVIRILNSSRPDFDSLLRRVCQETGCSLAFDCTAGEMPGRLLSALPGSGTVALYGYLTPGPVSFMPQSLFPERRLVTFEINEHLGRLSLASKARLAWRVRQGMGKQFRSEIQRVFKLDEGVEALAWYSQNMTAGKVQIKMV